MPDVPAWTVQTGSYTHPDYMFILTDEIGLDGWPNTKLVYGLTPVNAEQQKRLGAIRPPSVSRLPARSA